MKILRVLFAVLVFMISGAVVAEGCRFDAQCKGDRVCEDGRCVKDRGTGAGGDKGEEDWWCCNVVGAPTCRITQWLSQQRAGSTCACPGFYGYGYSCRQGQ
jgi:hypothetical protein